MLMKSKFAAKSNNTLQVVINDRFLSAGWFGQFCGLVIFGQAKSGMVILTSLCGSPRFGLVWISKKTFVLMRTIRGRYWLRGCVGGSSFHTSWLVNSSLTFCWTLIGWLKRASYLPFDRPNLFYDLQDHVVPVTVNVITWSGGKRKINV